MLASAAQHLFMTAITCDLPNAELARQRGMVVGSGAQCLPGASANRCMRAIPPILCQPMVGSDVTECGFAIVRLQAPGPLRQVRAVAACASSTAAVLRAMCRSQG